MTPCEDSQVQRQHWRRKVVTDSACIYGESNNLSEMGAESGGLCRHFLLPFAPAPDSGATYTIRALRDEISMPTVHISLS